MDDAIRQERRGLVISACAAFTLGVVGMAFFAITGADAILLDGLFNLSYFVTGLFTLKVAELLQRGDDKQFPYGYAFFEPLVNGVKGLLVLGISVMAFAGAVQALFTGGREIAAGAAILYGAIASTVCWTMALMMRVFAKRTESPLLVADAANWVVNAAISTAVLVAFLSILVLQAVGLDRWTPYVDPTVVVIVALASVSVPGRMTWQAVMELLNRAPPKKIRRQVTKTLRECLADLPVQGLFVRVIQPGRTRMVTVHVVLPSDFRIAGLGQLDGIRAKSLAALEQGHPGVVLDMVFTADPAWGAPVAAPQGVTGM
ncbi:MAG: cation diffusion facilitator family transporter [Alphaproteobacteria bacterium]|nr:cation diffusion facilitator family transporter [Alphaproteobacteria bacterium]